MLIKGFFSYSGMLRKGLLISGEYVCFFFPLSEVLA